MGVHKFRKPKHRFKVRRPARADLERPESAGRAIVTVKAEKEASS